MISARIKFSGLFMLLTFLCVTTPGSRLLAQETSESTNKPAEKQKKEAKELPPDPEQRSADVLYMQRMGKSGVDRGQEIYYTKCWICHNDYTRKVDPKAAPTLKGLFQRAKLMSGKPVNEENVMAQIREGSANMPSYKSGLNDKDLADLMAYLKEKCCWDEQNPPVNPRYRH